jgi:N-acyl-L-homoserine lactone synthetase
MLEVVQAGQAGKTKLLFDMHRLRTRVFKERMGWDVSISDDGLEVDQFDLPETIYLLVLDDDEMIGSWRLLPTNGPTMIRDVWPEFLRSIDLPSDPDVWEASRFAVNSPIGDPGEGLAQVSRATQELLCGVTELCLLCGVREIYTMYDMRIARLLKRLNCKADIVSKQLEVAGNRAQVGAFHMNDALLARLRQASGIRHRLVAPSMLPPLLQSRLALPRIAMEASRLSAGGRSG